MHDHLMNPFSSLNALNRISTRSPHVLRRLAATAWVEFYSSLADRTQILALMNAVIATYLILQTASFAKLVDEANSWALAVQ